MVNSADHFLLHFNGATGVDDLQSANGNIRVNDHTVNIAAPASAGENALVEIFSMSGQRAYSQQITLGKLTQIQVNLSGIYIIRVTFSKDVMVKKGFFR